jgi:hypothetical protein
MTAPPAALALGSARTAVGVAAGALGFVVLGALAERAEQAG